MTYLEDLSPCTYLDKWDTLGLVSVGWLSKDVAFSTGPVDASVREQLARLLEDPYCPVAFFGAHQCEFCTPLTAHPHDDSYPHGYGNLLVPGDGTIFACPELIAHYIDVHGYRPPDVFLAAVSACPPVDSDAYFVRLIEIGGAAWVDTLSGCAEMYDYHPTDGFESDLERRLAKKDRRRAQHMRGALRRFGFD